MRTPTHELRIAASTSMGRPAYWHDTRRTHTYNVNTDLIKDNVVLVDEIKGRNIDEYINEMMQPYIDEYNTKQKRKDRRIEMSYTDWHKLNDNKGEMVYEFVMQFGEHKDLGKMYYEEIDEEKKNELRKQFIDTYKKWKDDWQKQHPNQKILWAVIHFDENGGDLQKHVGGTPHLHIAVTPISHEFKRGPKCQISMSKSLESDGFKRKDERKDGYQLERAFKKFREIQERDLIEMGYGIKPENGGKHLEPEAYRQIMEEADKKLEQAEEKALKMVSFAEFTEKAKKAAEKIIDEKDSTVIFDMYKEKKWGAEKFEAAIQRKDIYESKHARQNIGSAIEHIDMQTEKIKKFTERAIEMIKSDGRSEAEKEIKELRKELQEKNELIRKHEKTIEDLKYYIQQIAEFIQSLNLVQRWNQMWERKKLERKAREEEMERIR